MKHIQTKLITLALLLFSVATSVSAQTKIDATVLLKAGGNNTQLYTNGSGAVLWGNAATHFTEGAAIDITNNTFSVDPTGLTGLGTSPANDDYFMLYDLSASALKSVRYQDLLAGISIIMSDGTNSQELNPGSSIYYASTSSDGYDFIVGATDQVSFAYDFGELSNLASVDAAADRLLILDNSSGNYFYINPNQLSGGGTDFTISDGTNTQNVNTGETLLFTDAANGIDVVVGATNQVTYDLDLNELTTETVVDYAADFIPIYDVSATAERKVLLSNLIAAPTSADVAIVSNTAANTNIASGLTLANFRKLVVFLDGVRQTQTTDWVISGNNIQFTFATNAGQKLSIEAFK